ncbi:MAG: NTP transferase domain-containing protein [Oscillospiraceae bacterium]|nr:NTP transferase domain-containing protein [Oscillospiraceae bacterium]
MKAVILAGGEGTRLRPLSCGIPKPMVPFYGRPIMEYAVKQLKKAEVTDLSAALCYLPGQIENHFMDGSRFGVKMRYSIERSPLGTAGAVRSCGPFSDDEDVFIVSGDGIFDFDLKSCLEFHRSKKAEVTIVTYPHENPLEYGLVLCDKQGLIQRFIEKPTWDQVFTNSVNTGIYIIKGRILNEIDSGTPVDFARDLFPSLLKNRRRLYAVSPAGYWCDVGSCDSYLKCAVDVLWKKTSLELPEEKTKLPPSARVIEPCYIGPGVSIGENCIIGPDAVVFGNSVLGSGSLVQNSVLLGARLGENATVFGSICAAGSSVGAGAILNEGCVLGEGAVIGRDAVLTEGVRVWPNRSVEQGVRLRHNLVTGFVKAAPSFSDKAVISGEASVELGAETASSIGSAAAVFGEVALSRDKNNFSDAAALAFEAGLRMSGGRCVRTDARFPMEAAFVSRKFGLPLSVFSALEKSRCRMHFFGVNGLPLNREGQRRMEGIIARGEERRALGWQSGSTRELSGVHKAYLEDATEGLTAPRLAVRLEGAGEENPALGEALRMMQVKEGGLSVPTFTLSGAVLTGTDEEGLSVGERELLLIACRAALEKGWALTVPWDFTAAADILAQSMGKTVARGEQVSPPFLYDGLFAACLVCAYLSEKNQTLQTAVGALPKFSSGYASIELLSGRAAVMRELAAKFGDTGGGSGLRRREKQGWVHIVPSAAVSAIKIHCEAESAEIAQELCADFSRLARDIDRRIYNSDKKI